MCVCVCVCVCVKEIPVKLLINTGCKLVAYTRQASTPLLQCCPILCMPQKNQYNMIANTSDDELFATVKYHVNKDDISSSVATWTFIRTRNKT